MKKILLTLGISLLGLVGAFASADFMSYIENDGEGGYLPSVLPIDGNYSFSVSDLQDYYCDEHDCGLNFVKDGNVVCSIVYNDRNTPDIVLNNGNSCVLSAGNYSLVSSESSFGSIIINFNSVSGGDINEDDNNGSLLPGGEGDLSGIISGLSDTINEFIPYLVYLGLGIITALIGFVAIKWLINRTSSKVRGTFRSGKRRR